MGGRGQRKPRVEVGSHLEFIRKLPCLGCGRRMNVEAAHLRFADPLYGKRETGQREKSSDRWVLPLCARHHAEQHTGNELVFWQQIGLDDPLMMALVLWGLTGDIDGAETVIALFASRRRLR
jgi:hypothetical protein